MLATKFTSGVLHLLQMTSPRHTCELTVIIGSVDAADTLHECISSLRTACSGVDAEILLIDASRDGGDQLVRKAFPELRIVTMPLGTLVPVLWGAGLREARGRVVAFTIGQCIVEPGWARAMLAGVASGAAGVGGRLALRTGSDATARATFFLRYSAWLTAPSGRVHEIAGDNAAYEHEALLAASDSLPTGFWEIDVHARFRELGKWLIIHPDATVRFTGESGLGKIAARRFAHGKHSGAYRVTEGIRPRWQMVLGAPVVPVVLLARVAHPVARAPEHWTAFLTSMGAFLVLATAWAAGEAIGGLTAQPKSRQALRVA